MTQWDDPRATPPQYGQQPVPGQQPMPGQPPVYSQPPVSGQRPVHYGDPVVNPFGTAGDHAFGIAGMVTGLLGGIMLVVSFTTLDWFKGGVTFGDIHDGLGNNAPGFASAYFNWFAWLFLILAVGAAVLSSFPSPALRAFRVIGVVAGFAAAGLSFLAIQLNDQTAYSEYLKNARIGFYLAVVGFLLAGIGSAIGPRKV